MIAACSGSVCLILAVFAGAATATERMTVEYASLLGGRGFDKAFASAVGPDGSIYLAGLTFSTEFPRIDSEPIPSGPFRGDGIVAKVTADGRKLEWAYRVGGSGYDIIVAMVADEDGAVYVTGLTQSADFPTTPAALQTRWLGDGDAFVIKISGEGNLLYSTLLGGSGTDGGNNIAVGPLGDVFIVGGTDSADLPQSEKSGTSLQGNSDAFVVRMS